MTFENLDSQIAAYKQLLIDIRVSPITYLSGHSSSGKTTLAKKVLSELKHRVISIYIDCCKLTTPTEFLDLIAQQLIHEFSADKIDEAYGKRISSKESFYSLLRLCDSIRQRNEKTANKIINLTLDHVDYLKRTNLIDSLQFLWSMTDTIASLGFLMISHDCYLFDSIKKQTERASLHKRTSFIHLKPWTIDDLVTVISQDKPKKRPEIYKDFVRNTISTFSYKDGTGINRYYHVMKELCQKNFEDYIRTCNDKSKDKFAANLMLQKNKEALREGNEQTGLTLQATHTATFICLLISVYFAAYTTASDDKINWVKKQKRAKFGRRRVMDRGDKQATSFTLERLLHIYRHIMARFMVGAMDIHEMKVLPDQILEYVSLLEHMYILHRCGGDLLDGDTRYRITNRLRKSYVQEQASLLGIRLSDYSGIET